MTENNLNRKKNVMKEILEFLVYTTLLSVGAPIILLYPPSKWAYNKTHDAVNYVAKRIPQYEYLDINRDGLTDKITFRELDKDSVRDTTYGDGWFDISFNKDKISQLEHQAEVYWSESIKRKLGLASHMPYQDSAEMCYKEVLKLIPEKFTD